MANEPKNAKSQFIDDSYLISEMIDELEAADANAETLIKSQETLADIIKQHPKEAEGPLKNVITGIETSNAEWQRKLEKNRFRINCLKSALLIAKDDINVRYGLSMLLEGLGIANSDCLPFEKRPELAVEDEKTEKKEA